MAEKPGQRQTGSSVDGGRNFRSRNGSISPSQRRVFTARDCFNRTFYVDFTARRRPNSLTVPLMCCIAINACVAGHLTVGASRTQDLKTKDHVAGREIASHETFDLKFNCEKSQLWNTIDHGWRYWKKYSPSRPTIYNCRLPEKAYAHLTGHP